MRKKLVALLVAGLVMAGAGYALNGSNTVYWADGWFRAMAYEKRTLKVEEPLTFERMEVRASMADVEVVIGDSFALEAEYWNGAEPRYTLEDGVLRVFDEGGQDITMKFVVMGMSPRSNWIKVVLPRSLRLADVAAHSDMGSVDVRGISADSLDVSASLGTLRISQTRTETFQAEAQMGDTTLREIQCSELTVKTGMGSIHADGVSSGNARFEVGAGSARMKNLDTRALSVQCALGDAHVSGTLAGQTVVQSNMGNVYVDSSLPRANYAELNGKSNLGDSIVPSLKPGETIGGSDTLTALSDMGKVEIRCGVSSNE